MQNSFVTLSHSNSRTSNEKLKKKLVTFHVTHSHAVTARALTAHKSRTHTQSWRLRQALFHIHPRIHTVAHFMNHRRSSPRTVSPSLVRSRSSDAVRVGGYAKHGVHTAGGRVFTKFSLSSDTATLCSSNRWPMWWSFMRGVGNGIELG